MFDMMFNHKIYTEPHREKKAVLTFHPTNYSVRMLGCEAVYLDLWLKYNLGIPLTWSNSIGSGETVRMRGHA